MTNDLNKSVRGKTYNFKHHYLINIQNLIKKVVLGCPKIFGRFFIKIQVTVKEVQLK